MSNKSSHGSSLVHVATPRCLALAVLLAMVIVVSSRSIKSIDRGAVPSAQSNEKLLTDVHKRHQSTDLKDLRRRCIQVTGGACKTMEAYNLAKLQQSAMPMEWGKRSNADVVTPIFEAPNAMGAVADQSAFTANDQARALLFFLRPQMKVWWQKQTSTFSLGLFAWNANMFTIFTLSDRLKIWIYTFLK